MFAIARHLSLSWASSIQSILPHPNSWRSILVLFSHLHLVLPSGHFPSGPPSKTLYTLLLSSILAPHISFSQFYHPNNIGWGVQIIQLLILQLPPLPCYLVPPRPKYFSQQPIPKHPSPAFLPKCERPSFPPIKNNRKNYSSVYLNL